MLKTLLIGRTDSQGRNYRSPILYKQQPKLGKQATLKVAFKQADRNININLTFPADEEQKKKTIKEDFFKTQSNLF